MSLGIDRLDRLIFSGSPKVKLKQIGAAGRLWKEGVRYARLRKSRAFAPCGRKGEGGAAPAAPHPPQEGSLISLRLFFTFSEGIPEAAGCGS